ncbi:RNA polymerase sigma factor [Sphingobacterium spiritivorum]|uniref:RNA polymerase sigma factor n=1 Tax=Sphingobacterium spiritivorum TaxID=258 RepID=A0A380CPS9_SPHSI|nr:sigma-70 family RNA polymerase sigma factor [Sphingobacterium spiritivorum]SUJ26178.1 RNA polymerase sigma factor [Sphingobacterium spiritivorum]
MKAYESIPDSELLLYLAEKDHTAFTELYTRHWKVVYAICLNRIKEPAIAEDLVQDIFLSLWTHAQPQNIRNLEAYLFQATKFSIIKHINKSQKHLYTNEHGLFDQLEDYNLDEVLHYKWVKELIFQEVEKLPLKTQLIFRYSRQDHLNSKEIADKLDISPRTVENQISKVLKILRKVVKTIIFFAFFSI